MGVLSTVSNGFYFTGILTWDLFLTLGNLVFFSLPVGKVTPEGHPGYRGYWPEYRPPQEGDSRCSCPALNALANHNMISRSGRGIKFTELTTQIRSTYNFGGPFCSLLPHHAAQMLNRSYSKDTFDLHELDLHNGIEHDASLTRLDTAHQPNQEIKHIPFIEELLSFATGKDADENPLLTKEDVSRILGKRRAEAKANNPEYAMSFTHRIFGSANSSMLLTTFGGRVDDLRSWLLEERFPEGWESHSRQPFGLTLLTLNLVTVLPVEFGIRVQDWAADAERIKAASRNTAEAS